MLRPNPPPQEPLAYRYQSLYLKEKHCALDSESPPRSSPGCLRDHVPHCRRQNRCPRRGAAVAPAPVPTSDTYVATIKSRRSATIQPQVDGNLIRIFVKSGDAVK